MHPCSPMQSPRPLFSPENSDSTESFVNAYRRWFSVEIADNDEARLEVYKLRYQVYVIENAYEDASQFANGLESDVFDGHSEHVILRHRTTGLIAGTARIIRHSPDTTNQNYPFQYYCPTPFMPDANLFPLDSTVEVSRFCVSKDFRRRARDNKFPKAIGGQNRPMRIMRDADHLVLPHITLGIIEGLISLCAKYGYTHWCAAMEPTLLRLLKRMGLYFEPIGAMVDFHGRRQPCYQKLDTLLTRARTERPDVWAIITDYGRLQEDIRNIRQVDSYDLGLQHSF